MIFSIISIYYNIVQVTMTYNLCYFLGNKAFVIDFLVTGLLAVVCVCGRSKGIIQTEFSFLPGVLTGLITLVCLLCRYYLSTECYEFDIGWV